MPTHVLTITVHPLFYTALFQDRPQFTTVSSGSSQLDPVPKRLRPSQSESFLPVDEGEPSLPVADEEPSLLVQGLPEGQPGDTSESKECVETLSQLESGDGAGGTTSELTDTTTPEKPTDLLTEPTKDQGDRASESSDEVQGFVKLEREEVDKDADKEKVEPVGEGKKDEGISKKDLESLGASEVSDTELRYRLGHGAKEETH